MNYFSSCFTGSTSATEISKDYIGVAAAEFEAVSASISNVPKKRKYVKFTREEILNIGKYASIHGNSRAARNIQFEKALFDFTGKSMNKASQVPQKSNVVDHFY